MKNGIHFFERGRYVVYVTDSKIKQKLASWQDVKLLNHYLGYGWDFVFPARLYNRVAALIGQPLKEKHPNRVLAGKQSKIANGSERHDLTKVNSAKMPCIEPKSEEAYETIINV